MSNSQSKNKQHYVYRAYLKNWSIDSKNIYMVQKSKKNAHIAAIKSILYDNRIYELRPLNNEETKFMEAYLDIMKCHENVSAQIRSHMDISQTFYKDQELISLFRGYIESIADESIRHKLKSDIDNIYNATVLGNINAEEEFHCEFEIEGIKFLNNIIETHSLECIYASEDNLESFMQYIMIQYFRTKKMRNQLKSNLESTKEFMCEKYNIDSSNVRAENVIPHIIWLLQGMVADYLIRNKANISIEVNETGLDFVTADQPIINASVNPDKNIILYYPISPKVTLRINSSKGKKILERGEITAVLDRNQKMIVNADEFIICKSLKMANNIANELKALS